MLSSVGAEYFSSPHSLEIPAGSPLVSASMQAAEPCSVGLHKQADFLFPNSSDFIRLFLWKSGKRG